MNKPFYKSVSDDKPWKNLFDFSSCNSLDEIRERLNQLYGNYTPPLEAVERAIDILTSHIEKYGHQC